LIPISICTINTVLLKENEDAQWGLPQSLESATSNKLGKERMPMILLTTTTGNAVQIPPGMGTGKLEQKKMR